jgi:hypothetical protein
MKDPIVAIVNHSTVVSDREVTAAVHALQLQVSNHFEPHWNAGAALLVVHSTPAGNAGAMRAAKLAQQLPAGAWLLSILDDSDQADALGYHELDAKGIPNGKVFAKTDRENKLSWTVTASHELLEMLGDPYANLCVQVAKDGTALAYETGDAVEDDRFGYKIGKVLVSDFVYPSWFIAGSSGPWDYGGHCTAPLQLLPGGYIGVWKPGKGWTQATAEGDPRHKDGPRFRMRVDGTGLPAEHHVPSWIESYALQH